MPNNMFTETQSFRKWWQILIITIPHLFFLNGIYQQVFLDTPFGDNPMPDTGLFVSEGIMILVMILFYLLKLETKVDHEGVSVRFLPFIPNYRQYKWSDISKAYVREYSPIMEYGGWGLRGGFWGRGGAWNVSGSTGLQIEMKDGTMFLIGTQKPEELSAVLMQYYK